MKKNKFKGKLKLNKERISNLDLTKIKGGVDGDSNPYGSKCSCWPITQEMK